jgi:hypothetical protein
MSTGIIGAIIKNRNRLRREDQKMEPVLRIIAGI